MDARDIILFIIAALNLLFGFIVTKRNSRRAANRVYALVVIAAAAWAVGLAGFRITGDLGIALWWARIYYVAAALIAYFFLLFSIMFPYQRVPR